MSGVREPAVAGRFYPRDPGELRATVEGLLAAAAEPSGELPAALVAPHAGYVYSGAVAASAFRELAPVAAEIRRVVLVGPSHFVALDGLALAPHRAFATPLGEIELDAGGAAAIRDLPEVALLEAPHAREHALEVELPFLQVLLPAFTLVPLVVGTASPEEVARVLARLDGDTGTLVVVSTDLSHYLDAAAARRRDAATAAAILALAPERVADGDACGATPLRGLLARARARGLGVRELDRRTSADTAGSPERVVGYGAYAFG